MTTTLITGATDGIGRATALGLAAHGHRILVHGRSPERVAAVVEAVRGVAGNGGAEGVVADFGSLRAVRGMAAMLRDRETQLDVLVNNAGVFAEEWSLSRDGVELTLAVNHVAHQALTVELMPLLRAAQGARVMTVSSVAHRRAQDELDDPNLERGWSGYRAYAWSKLANVWFSAALARRGAEDGVVSNALHPGVIGTKLLRAGFQISGADPADGAQIPIQLATAPEGGIVTGRYFRDGTQVQPAPLALDEDRQELLWAWTEGVIG